jgi:type II secretory pathway predicted ATPase ExeA
VKQKAYDFNLNIRIQRALWQQFKTKHPNPSERLRQLIEQDMKEIAGIPKVNRNDVQKLKEMIFQNSLPIQICGFVGIGKTTIIQRLIKEDKQHVYVVLDCHNEYSFLPEIFAITNDLKESCRIKMPKQVSAARAIYNLYHNQILSQKWPENFVIVIEEAHRYSQVKELLKEARKFVKVIAICQEPIGNFCPIVEIVGD